MKQILRRYGKTQIKKSFGNQKKTNILKMININMSNSNTSPNKSTILFNKMKILLNIIDNNPHNFNIRPNSHTIRMISDINTAKMFNNRKK